MDRIIDFASYDDENGNAALNLDDIQEDAKKFRPYDYVWDMYYDEFEDASEEEIREFMRKAKESDLHI